MLALLDGCRCGRDPFTARFFIWHQGEACISCSQRPIFSRRRYTREVRSEDKYLERAAQLLDGSRSWLELAAAEPSPGFLLHAVSIWRLDILTYFGLPSSKIVKEHKWAAALREKLGPQVCAELELIANQGCMLPAELLGVTAVFAASIAGPSVLGPSESKDAHKELVEKAAEAYCKLSEEVAALTISPGCDQEAVDAVKTDISKGNTSLIGALTRRHIKLLVEAILAYKLKKSAEKLVKAVLGASPHPYVLAVTMEGIEKGIENLRTQKRSESAADALQRMLQGGAASHLRSLVALADEHQFASVFINVKLESWLALAIRDARYDARSSAASSSGEEGELFSTSRYLDRLVDAMQFIGSETPPRLVSKLISSIELFGKRASKPDKGESHSHSTELRLHELPAPNRMEPHLLLHAVHIRLYEDALPKERDDLPKLPKRLELAENCFERAFSPSLLSEFNGSDLRTALGHLLTTQHRTWEKGMQDDLFARACKTAGVRPDLDRWRAFLASLTNVACELRRFDYGVCAIITRQMLEVLTKMPKSFHDNYPRGDHAELPNFFGTLVRVVSARTWEHFELERAAVGAEGGPSSDDMGSACSITFDALLRLALVFQNLAVHSRSDERIPSKDAFAVLTRINEALDVRTHSAQGWRGWLHGAHLLAQSRLAPHALHACRMLVAMSQQRRTACTLSQLRVRCSAFVDLYAALLQREDGGERDRHAGGRTSSSSAEENASEIAKYGVEALEVELRQHQISQPAAFGADEGAGSREHPGADTGASTCSSAGAGAGGARSALPAATQASRDAHSPTERIDDGSGPERSQHASADSSSRARARSEGDATAHADDVEEQRSESSVDDTYRDWHFDSLLTLGTFLGDFDSNRAHRTAGLRAEWMLPVLPAQELEASRELPWQREARDAQLAWHAKVLGNIARTLATSSMPDSEGQFGEFNGDHYDGLFAMHAFTNLVQAAVEHEAVGIEQASVPSEAARLALYAMMELRFTFVNVKRSVDEKYLSASDLLDQMIYSMMHNDQEDQEDSDDELVDRSRVASALKQIMASFADKYEHVPTAPLYSTCAFMFRALMDSLPTIFAHERFGNFCRMLASPSGESAALSELKAVLSDLDFAVFTGFYLQPLFLAEIAEYVIQLSTTFVDCALQSMINVSSFNRAGYLREGVISRFIDMFKEQSPRQPLTLEVMALAHEFFAGVQIDHDEPRWATIAKLPFAQGCRKLRELFEEDARLSVHLHDDDSLVRLYIARFTLAGPPFRSRRSHGRTLAQALEQLPCRPVETAFLAPTRWLLDAAASLYSMEEADFAHDSPQLQWAMPLIHDVTRALATVNAVFKCADSHPALCGDRDDSAEVSAALVAAAYVMTGSGSLYKKFRDPLWHGCHALNQQIAQSASFCNDALALIKLGMIGVKLKLGTVRAALDRGGFDAAIEGFRSAATESLWVHRSGDATAARANAFEEDIIERAQVRRSSPSCLHLPPLRRAMHSHPQDWCSTRGRIASAMLFSV